MAIINLTGEFAGGTGSVSWALKGINNAINLHHTEDKSFDSPITLPKGLYTLVLQGACSKEFTFDVKGTGLRVLPDVPDEVTKSGGVIDRAYALHIA